ncbi:MAG: PAS domain-containing protein [Acaryochloridaceae cyanobacterium RU_4_10]|nr:PAS domain-containing protein [Acaryochloridaceae cyanobacterium RU_4_10]
MKQFILPKIRFFRVNTIGAKLFLAIMGGAFVGLGSAAFLYYQVLEQQSEVQIRDTLSTEVNGIESKLTPVKQSLKNLGGMVQHLKENGIHNPNAYQTIALDFFLKRPPLVMGQSIQQTPYGVFADRKWYASYYYEDQKVSGQIGKRLASPNTSVLFSDLVKEDNSPNQAYFRDTIAVRQDTWLEPYDWYNISMTTANHLLWDRRGRLQGFVSMDVNATQLSATIHPSVIHNTGYFVVMTQRGTLVSYPPDMGKVRQSYRSIPTLATIWPLLQKDTSGLFQSNGKYWAYQRVPSTQWIMLAVVPESVVFWPVLAITLGGAGIAAIVLALVVICFVQFLNRRLKPILDECYRLEVQDVQRSIRLGQSLEEQNATHQNTTFNFKQVDELEILQQVFRQVTAQLKASFDDLELRVTERTAELQQSNLRLRIENTMRNHDIKERQRAELSLHEAKDQLQAVLDAVPGSVAWIQSDLKYLGVNQLMANMFGRSAEDFIGQTVGFLQIDIQPLHNFIESFFKEQLNYATTEIELLIGQENKHYLVVGQQYLDGKAAVFIGMDITERKQAETKVQQALEQTQELSEFKSRFISNTSHEFRTPLTSIMAASEILEHYGEQWPQEKKLRYLMLIQKSVNQMINLLDDVLIISAGEAGKIKLSPIPVDIVAFCEMLIEEIKINKNYNHILNFTYMVEQHQVSLDEKIMRQILGNLLSNAVKYSPENKSIEFDLTVDTEHIIFRIADRGIGIPQEDRIHLFDLFHRANNVGTIPGTGLGLSIVKRAVELYGGTIDVNSEVGKGTQFTVLLPINNVERQ